MRCKMFLSFESFDYNSGRLHASRKYARFRDIIRKRDNIRILNKKNKLKIKTNCDLDNATPFFSSYDIDRYYFRWINFMTRRLFHYRCSVNFVILKKVATIFSGKLCTPEKISVTQPDHVRNCFFITIPLPVSRYSISKL